MHPNWQHLCIDPWSTAGLAGTVLAVAATVLAILGAVAVAAWWTSLNDRVNEQVKKLYKTHKTEINSRVDLLLKEQQQKVVEQMVLLQDKLALAHISIDRSLKLAEESSRVSIESKTYLGEMTEKLKDMETAFAIIKSTNDAQLLVLSHLIDEISGAPPSKNPQTLDEGTSTPDEVNQVG